jgi:hypothetical protein
MFVVIFARMKIGPSILLLLFLATLGQPCLSAAHCLDAEAATVEMDACHQHAKDHCDDPCDTEIPDSQEEEPCTGSCTCVGCSPIVLIPEHTSITGDLSVSSRVNPWVSRMPALDVDHLIWQPPQR